MSKKRVLLGMSGGVDSSVSALLLKKMGFEVVGITFLFANLKLQTEKISTESSELARKIDIQHHIIDLRKEFESQIVSRFLKEYQQGRTPFPCAFCNPEVKFYYLAEFAKELNCQFISTGHYVKTTEKQGVRFISEGKDKNKDQSFFLWGLDGLLIKKLIFPLGDLTKQEVRKIALKHGFNVLSKKKDSLGICFIEGKDYRNFMKERGISAEPGNFVDKQGKILGKHNGIINYTVGQRRGLGLNLNQPVFVSQINAKKNEIILSEFNDLYKSRIFINNFQFVEYETIDIQKKYNVRVRYRLQETPSNIKIHNENQVEIILHEPLAMVAKGQTAVFYDEECVIGGGFIQDSR